MITDSQVELLDALVSLGGAATTQGLSLVLQWTPRAVGAVIGNLIRRRDVRLVTWVYVDERTHAAKHGAHDQILVITRAGRRALKDAS